MMCTDSSARKDGYAAPRIVGAAFIYIFKNLDKVLGREEIAMEIEAKRTLDTLCLYAARQLQTARKNMGSAWYQIEQSKLMLARKS